MRTDTLRNAYDEILETASLEEYQTKAEEYVLKLEKEGFIETACRVRELSAIQINRFSKQATQENFEYSKKAVLTYLKNMCAENRRFSQNEAVKIVKTILENFHEYCRSLYKEKVHQKCGESLRMYLPYLAIENEYDIQRLLYPVIRAVFADARMEETEDSGHHMVRKDLVIDSCDLVIELKCSGETTTERRLSEEIAADMVHYGNKHIFFYIYDKENVIKNPIDFKNTYENKRI